ncbi:hypothetical protein COOONC_16316 [Cooperia oncophora]
MPGVAVVIANYSILFEVFFFNIVGCFGNVQLLWTTYRKKSTHTKPGILLAINAFYHIICLIGELVNAAFIIRVPWIRQARYPEDKSMSAVSEMLFNAIPHGFYFGWNGLCSSGFNMGFCCSE